MTTIFARETRLPDHWGKNVSLEIDNGRILRVSEDSQPNDCDVRVDCLLPALANLHCHTFQRAMAGMTEYRTAGNDSFWTWRQLMYKFLTHLTPEMYEAIAGLVYMEMLEAGYASVGEFHYVHHQQNGGAYDALDELSQRIFAAANHTGIGLTHLPVLYTYGGTGQKPLAGGQLRFGNDVETFNRLVECAKTSAQQMDTDTRVGIAPHSLRATTPDDLQSVLSAHPTGPVHIHIAEQLLEVEEISGWLGARPVEWLLKNMDVTDRWCLIHATHMTEEETVSMANSGAVAGLCPITEANLGDGPFNGPTYLSKGGAFGLGSDSNVRISLTEELRQLEYSQRLRDMARNVLVDGKGSTGETLYLGAAAGGAQSLGRESGAIRVGAVADLLAIDRSNATLFALQDHQLLDGLCFAAGDHVIKEVWSAGRHVVRDGRHIRREEILRLYKASMEELTAAL